MENVFTQYINGDKFQHRSLNGIPVGRKYLAYPEGIGGTPIGNSTPTSSQTIPFTLFMPYKRARGLDGFYSTGNKQDELFTKLPSPTYAIALPTPTSALKTEYRAAYSSFEVGQALGAMGSSMAGFLKINPDNAIKEAAKTALKTAATTTKVTVINAIGGLLEEVGSDKSVSNVFFGAANNPYTENVFKNMEFRTHTFSYVFMPRSLKESEIIDDIITIFKYAMHPKPSSDNLLELSAGTGFFDFPLEFQITHSIQDTTFTLLPSVLESLEVDYSGGTDIPKLLLPQDKKQQYPAKITLNMSFKEMVLLSRNRITGDKTRVESIFTEIEKEAPTGLRFRF